MGNFHLKLITFYETSSKNMHQYVCKTPHTRIENGKAEL